MTCTRTVSADGGFAVEIAGDGISLVVVTMLFVIDGRL